MSSKASSSATKYLKIQDAIHQKVRAGKWRPGEPIPSVRELSERHQTSMLTARRAVESLVSRGMLVASQGVGTFVSPKPTFHRVGIVLGVGPGGTERDILGPRRFLRLTESGLHAWADRHMLNVCTYEYRSDNQIWNDHSPLRRDIENNSVDGLILVGVDSPPLATELLRRRVPAVAIGNVPVALPYRVIWDGRAFMDCGVEILKAAGCQRLGVIGVEPHLSHPMVVSPADRFASACLSQNVEIMSQRVVQVQPATPQTGYQAACEMFALEPRLRPDGLIVADDVLAQGVLRCLKALPSEVSQTLRWVTHANFGGEIITHPALLGRLEYEPAVATEKAADMLASLMHGQPPARCVTSVAPRVIHAASD